MNSLLCVELNGDSCPRIFSPGKRTIISRLYIHIYVVTSLRHGLIATPCNIRVPNMLEYKTGEIQNMRTLSCHISYLCRTRVAGAVVLPSVFQTGSSIEALSMNVEIHQN